MTKKEAIADAKRFGRSRDNSRGHRFYRLKDLGTSIDVILGETVIGTWRENRIGVWERAE